MMNRNRQSAALTLLAKQQLNAARWYRDSGNEMRACENVTAARYNARLARMVAAQPSDAPRMGFAR